MDRNDIIRAKEIVPELGDIWENKILTLEKERERAWNDLRRSVTFQGPEVDPVADDVYRRIQRMDRSIAFLDRALLHLTDVERGTHYADDLPLRV
jgi:hypothetical protein